VKPEGHAGNGGTENGQALAGLPQSRQGLFCQQWVGGGAVQGGAGATVHEVAIFVSRTNAVWCGARSKLTCPQATCRRESGRKKNWHTVGLQASFSIRRGLQNKNN